MGRIIQFSFPLANGLHARPASHLEEAIRPFSAEVTFLNRRNGRQSSGRNVLDLVSTDTQGDDPCELHIAGSDEDAAFSRLSAFLSDVYPHCDEPLAEPGGPGAGYEPLPPSLTSAGLSVYFRGQVACNGLGWGTLVTLEKEPLAVPSSWIKGTVAREREAFLDAHRGVDLQLQQELQHAGATERAVLGAHLSMVRDPGLPARILTTIESGMSAPEAIIAAVTALSAPLAQSQSAYLRERVLDIEDLGERLIRPFAGSAEKSPVEELPDAAIIVARSLTPSKLLSLRRERLQGIVLASTGTTSHTLLLARSFGIPTLVDMGSAVPRLVRGTEAILDGRLGVLVPGPGDGVKRYYTRLRGANERVAGRRAKEHLGSATKDGVHLEIGANIALADEAQGVFDEGADGIGLFRTEMAFMGRSTPPGEEEQAQAYLRAVHAAKGARLIIRLVDIGGDKPVSYLRFPEEQNPFLGYRGVRWYSRNEALVRTQLRALVRAACEGPISILIPMISCVEEIRYCRRLLQETREAIQSDLGRTPAATPLGVMIEVPSVAFAIDECSKEVDFFSLGTNDLSQYFFAADRGNASVSDPNQCFQPSFLRFLKLIADGAKRNGRWIGICGEFAEHPLALPVLVSLGLDEASVSRSRIREIKRSLARSSAAHCRRLFENALACLSATEAMAALEHSAAVDSTLPPLTTDLVILESDSTSKEEAIREMVDSLRVAGRTEWPERIEAAVWKRESAYSTGFGDGFALPHCSCPDVNANSMVILRLRKPVAWQSLDGKPVDLAILLAARAETTAKDHLVILARFSRLLTRDEFRARLRSEANPEQLVRFVTESLGSGRTSRVP